MYKRQVLQRACAADYGAYANVSMYTQQNIFIFSKDICDCNVKYFSVENQIKVEVNSTDKELKHILD